MYRINGFLQNYAWGVPGGLLAWQSNEQRDATDVSLPQAELWYGAHANGPSGLVDQPGSLRDYVTTQQAPLLVKMLAARTPLSIQIHPPAQLAEARFAAQQLDPGLPKLLSDALAKTEMLIAVKPFSVFCGLRDLSVTSQIFHAVGPELDEARHAVNAGDVKQAIRILLALDASDLPSLTSRLPQAAVTSRVDGPGVAALELVAKTYPGDTGVFVAAMLAQRVLAPGEAIYVPAGVVHAYITGTGVEVMTASDNVLRLGLTSKTIAIDESLAALNPELSPEPMDGDPQPCSGGGMQRHYAPSNAPFIVDSITAGTLRSRAGNYRLVLPVEGSATVHHAGGQVDLHQGEALAVLADESEISVAARGVSFVARQSG